MGNLPKYQVKKSTNYQFYWVLIAVNGEPILNGETYSSKQGCLNGIASSKVCTSDSNFRRLTANNGQYYFNQIANNGEIIGKSEMYNTMQGRENGVSSVKRDAPNARIEDLT